ncbi:MAG: succinate dehydrogenase, hydrophobic membrane anchor protein [Rhizobiales bacterium]|nr:succinate dehydrogenase, hydrophobic membrane anchor protein [Hyphomicrobiales bacterium]
MTMRTPLGKVRGLGSAKSGAEHWLLERVVALANLPLNLFLVIFILMHLGAGRADIIESVRNPLIAGLLAMSVIAILWHMKLGMRAIIEDYVHGEATKLTLLVLNSAYTAILGVAAIYAILKMSFAS